MNARAIIGILILMPLEVWAATATTSGYWTNGATWDTPPVLNGDVTIGGGYTVTADVATVSLNSLTVGGTLVFSGWNTGITSTTVTVNGTVTHLPQSDTNSAGGWTPDNRIWIACTNLTVALGGRINANSNGYPRKPYQAGGVAGAGPGAGVGGWPSWCAGGGYGGLGSAYDNGYGGGLTYGSTNEPSDPGSGGYAYFSSYGGAGGGAIRIEANGLVTVNGEVTALGGNSEGSFGGAIGSGGSGGSIWITCRALSGAGRIAADGGDSRGDNGYPGGGGGGRIALIYDPAEQSNETAALYISAAGGGCLEASPYMPQYGYPGTIYMPHTSLLISTNLGGGRYIIPGWTNWTVGQLNLTNGTVVFPSGFSLHVLTDVVAQADGSLDLSNVTAQIDGKWLQTTSPKQGVPVAIYGGALSQTVIGGDMTLDGDIQFKFNAMTNEGMTLSVGGDLRLTNKAAMRIYGAPRFAAGANYGALVTVAGKMTVGSGSWIYPFCYPDRGTGVLFRARSLLVMTNAGFNANDMGYYGGANSAGHGPGGGAGSGGGPDVGGAGGGHGGVGGNGKLPEAVGGTTYGNSNAPVLSGSGGGTYLGGGSGGPGGGVIRIETLTGSMRIDGTLTANASDWTGTYGGGGSGGSIYLTCRVFSGIGALNARGGGTSQVNAGGGGGGRIAVWAVGNSFTGTTSVTNGTGYQNGGVGTVVWGVLSPPGTVFVVH